MLAPDRYFSPIPAVRATAQALYDEFGSLPLVCPHGHVDPKLLALDEPFSNPAALIVIPDHYIVRMLYSQGVPMESLGIPRLDGGAVETRPARDLAAVRGPLLPVPRHAERRVAGARVRGRLRHRRAADERDGDAHLRSDRREPAASRVPAPGALRALQDRSALHDRCGHRHARVPSADSRLRMERRRPPDVPAGPGHQHQASAVRGGDRSTVGGHGRGHHIVRGLYPRSREPARVLQVDGRDGHRPRGRDAVHGRTVSR